MHNIQVAPNTIIDIGTAFPDREETFQHGQDKVGFEGIDGAPNPTEICVRWNAGGKLLEVADFSTGGSEISGALGGDVDYIFSSQPYGQGTILGVLAQRNDSQPQLYEGNPLASAIGGASRFSSFVSETGAADEDPKPRQVADNTQQEQYETNRLTGQAAWTDYYVTIRRQNVNIGQEYEPLTLQVSGHTPQTDVTYPEPEASTGNYCSNCGAAQG